MQIITSNEWKQLKQSKRFIKPYYLQIVILYSVAIMGNIMELFPILLLGNIINYIVDKNFTGILQIIFLLFLIFVFSTILSAIETYLSNNLLNKVSRDIKKEVFRKVTKMSMNGIKDLTIGKLISVMESDSISIAQFYIVNLLDYLNALCTAFVSIIFLLTLSKQLTLVSLLSFPIIYVGYAIFGKKLKLISKEIKITNDRYISFVNTCFTNIKEIKNDCSEKRVQNSLNILVEQILFLNIKSLKTTMASNIFSLTVSSFSEWLIIGLGSWMIIYRNFLIGNYVSFNGYLQRFMLSLKGILNINIVLQTTIVSVQRIFDLFDIEEEKYYRIKDLVNVEGDIMVNNLTFRYKGMPKDALKDLTLKFNKNSMYVIVGVNGSGKSTFFNAILQYLDYDQGDVFIDKKNLKDINLYSLRKNIAYVQQGDVLFSGTIKNYFLYVNPQISDNEIKDICEMVGIRNIIEQLPDGYNTNLEDGAIKFSGGEYRKLMIAKALAKKARILLLDEITSDLDGNAEKNIMHLLIELSHNHTIVLISHRISSIIMVPNIYVLDKGNIVGKGNSETLMRECKQYQLLIDNQT